MTPKKFGIEIRNTRREAGLTQERAAAILGVSKRTLESIEHGESTLPTEREAMTQERALGRLATRVLRLTV